MLSEWCSVAPVDWCPHGKRWKSWGILVAPISWACLPACHLFIFGRFSLSLLSSCSNSWRTPAVLIFRGRQRAWTTPGNDTSSDVVVVQVCAWCEKGPISSKDLLLGGVVAVLPLMESCASQDIFMGPTLQEQWDTYDEKFVRHPAFAKAFAMAAMAKEK